MKGRASNTGSTTTKVCIFDTLCTYAQSEPGETRLLCTRDTAKLSDNIKGLLWELLIFQLTYGSRRLLDKLLFA
jgi:hypothetical protein